MTPVRIASLFSSSTQLSSLFSDLTAPKISSAVILDFVVLLKIDFINTYETRSQPSNLVQKLKKLFFLQLFEKQNGVMAN